MTTLVLPSIQHAEAAAKSEGLVEVFKTQPQESKTYGVVTAKYMVNGRTKPWVDRYWANLSDVRYLGKFERGWRNGSGDGMETFREFTHGGKTFTVRSGYFMCWVEMPAPETDSDRTVPADSYIYH